MNLATIAAKHQPHSCVVADTLDLPHPSSSFDFAISIAVIHHLSTPERRIEAVKALLEALIPPGSTESRHGGSSGKALIFVWALEQKGSRRGWDEGDEQDVMVPWVKKAVGSRQQSRRQDSGPNLDASKDASGTAEPETYMRYYHLYRKGELEANIAEAGGVVLESGYDRDNWWAVAARANV